MLNNNSFLYRARYALALMVYALGAGIIFSSFQSLLSGIGQVTQGFIVIAITSVGIVLVCLDQAEHEKQRKKGR